VGAPARAARPLILHMHSLAHCAHVNAPQFTLCACGVRRLRCCSTVSCSANSRVTLNSFATPPCGRMCVWVRAHTTLLPAAPQPIERMATRVTRS
jgi:hypothetical protein